MQQAAWASGARSELEAPLERNLIVHGLPPFVTESILYQALQQNPGVHSIRLLQASRGDSPTFTGVVTFQNAKQASTQLQLAPTLEFGTFSCPCTIEPVSQVGDAAAATTRERRGKRNRNSEISAAPSSVPVAGPNGASGGSRSSKRSRGGDSAHGGRLSYVGQRQMSLRTVFTPEVILNHVNALSRDGQHQQAYTYLVEHMEVFHDQRQLETVINPLLQNVRSHLSSLAPRISAQAGITTPGHIYLVGQRSPVLVQLSDTPQMRTVGRKSPVPDAYSDASTDDAMLTARSNSSASGYHSPMERSPSCENNEMMAGVQIAIAPLTLRPLSSSAPNASFVPGTIPTTARSFTPTLNMSGPPTTSLVPSSLRSFPGFANSPAVGHVQSPISSPHQHMMPIRPVAVLDSSSMVPSISFPSVPSLGPAVNNAPLQHHYESPTPMQSVQHTWVDARSPRLAAIQEAHPYAPEYDDDAPTEDNDNHMLGTGDGLVVSSSPPLSSYALEAATASSSVSSFSTSTQYSSSTAYSNYSAAAYYTPSRSTTSSKTVRHGNSAPTLTSAFSMALQTSHSPPAVLQTSHSPPSNESHFYRSIHSPLPNEEGVEHVNYFNDLDMPTMDGPVLGGDDGYFWAQQHLDG